MKISEIAQSYRIWQELLGNWGNLERKLFDYPNLPELLNLRAYLSSIEGAIEGQFEILEYVIRWYGSIKRYMEFKKGDLDDRNETNYRCSENNLLAFRKISTIHFKEQEIEDMERLLRYYLIDLDYPPAVTVKPLQTALPPSPSQASK